MLRGMSEQKVGPNPDDVARWVAILAAPRAERKSIFGSADDMRARGEAERALRSWGLDADGLPNAVTS